MENLLLMRINEKQIGDIVSAANICEKAKQLFEDEDKEKCHSIPAEDLQEVISCWNKLSKLMKDYHPDIAAVEMDLNHFNNTLMAHSWSVQKSRIKESNLDSFFKKVDKRTPTDESPTGK